MKDAAYYTSLRAAQTMLATRAQQDGKAIDDPDDPLLLVFDRSHPTVLLAMRYSELDEEMSAAGAA